MARLLWPDFCFSLKKRILIITFKIKVYKNKRYVKTYGYIRYNNNIIIIVIMVTIITINTTIIIIIIIM